MKAAPIPVYDIPAIEKGVRHGLLVTRFGEYLATHYEHLHHPHKHSFYHLVLFTAGSGTHAIDFESFPVVQGQAYFMIPGQVHGWQFGAGVDGYIVHFQDTFFNSFLQDPRYLERFSFFQGTPAQSVCQLPPAGLEEAVRLFEACLAEVALGDEHSLDQVRLLLLRFFALVARECAPAVSRPQTGLLVHHFQRLVAEHFRDLRLPKQYAALLYVTPNHLNALCQDLLGKTAGDIIRERILLEAKRLLVHTGGAVAAVADALNFDDPSYFNRFFKKYEGLTPEQFRKQQLHLK